MMKEQKHHKKKKIKELKYKKKTHTVVTNKLSWNNLFINQTYFLGAELLQQGVPKEWLKRLNDIKHPF